jgi:4-amino-4-deoxy-L-arabinose transferase-like glycosyltransferase
MITALEPALFRVPRAGNTADWLFLVLSGAGVSLGCLMTFTGVFLLCFST